MRNHRLWTDMIRPSYPLHSVPTAELLGTQARFSPAGCLLQWNGATAMAITSSFDPITGILSAIGTAGNESITFSRDASGNLLVNGGSAHISGGKPTVANTNLIEGF